MSICLYVVAAVNIFLLILLLLLRFCFDRALIIFIILISLNPRTELIHKERLASNVGSHLFLFRNVGPRLLVGVVE